MLISTIFFTGFLFFLFRIRCRRLILFFLATGFFLYLAATVFHLACDYFTDDGLTPSVLYHLRIGLNGADFGSYRNLIIAGSVALITALSAMVGLIVKKDCSRPFSPLRTTATSAIILVLALVTHPFFTHLGKIYLDSHRLHLDSSGQQSLKLNDLLPRKTPYLLPGSVRKNLVLIYLESLERTYFDQQIFPNLITRLSNLEKQGITFTDIRQLNSSWWTIGGMVASQCGIPLVTPSHGNSMSGIQKFYQGATCLGDILKDNGYSLTFMGGADLGFAGKGAFLKTHGFDFTLGSRELDAAHMQPHEFCGWGIHDDKLLDLAWNKFQRLADLQKPFVLSVLTLDTHHPNGFPSSSCRNIKYGDGSNPMLNAVACADRLVADFVEKIRQSSWGRKTVVVLLSDHLAMKNRATYLLKKKPRRDFFLILDPTQNRREAINRPGTSLDVGTTLLHILGFQGRLGLGTDLLAKEEIPSLVTKTPNLDTLLAGWRKYFLALWEFPAFNEPLMIDGEKHRLLAAGKSYPLPLLITGDNNLKATYYYGSEYKSLLQYLLDQRADTPFLLAEPCSSMWFLAGAGTKPGYCIASGKPGGTIQVKKVQEALHVSPEQLTAITSESFSSQQYETNMRHLFTKILGQEMVWMFDEVPDDSTVYVIRGRYGKYPNIYAGMPWIRKRGIRCVRSVPKKTNFFFLSRDIEKDRSRYPDYQLNVYRADHKLIDFLRKYLHDTIIISAKDDASQHLSKKSRAFFSQLGIPLTQLKFRDSFACVLDKGQALVWKISPSSPVILVGQPLRNRGIDQIISAGRDTGNTSKIIINGQNVSPDRRGLNIVVKKQNQKIIATFFDTFKQEWNGLAILKAQQN